MKKLLLTTVLGLSLVANTARAAEVRDWHDLNKVHTKIVQALQDMQRARAANHYDMDGHGAKAEDLLRQAEHELHDAVESAKHAQH